MNKIFIYLFSLLIFISCKQDENANVNFYNFFIEAPLEIDNIEFASAKDQFIYINNRLTKILRTPRRDGADSIVFNYNSNLLSQIKYYGWHASIINDVTYTNGKISKIGTLLFEYDNKNRIIKENGVDFYANLEYDSKNNLIKRTIYKKANNVLERNWEFVYDANNSNFYEVIESDTYYYFTINSHLGIIGNNPSSNNLTKILVDGKVSREISYEYDNKKRPARVFVKIGSFTESYKINYKQ